VFGSLQTPRASCHLRCMDLVHEDRQSVERTKYTGKEDRVKMVLTRTLRG
jgi:hypothetical protein